MNKDIEWSRIYEEGLQLLNYIEGVFVISKDKLENILTTDNPLSNRGAKAMTVGFSFSAVHVPVKLGL